MSNQTTSELLIEIGTEELPPKALGTLAAAFRDAVSARLTEARLAHGSARAYATPRRLALIIAAVADMQPDEVSTRRGPALQAAFDADGRPTKAALGFARSCGVEVEALGREESDKGAWLSHEQEIKGEATAVLLPALVERALGDLPIPKRMRWGERDVEFVRPVHWVCVLLGAQPIDGTVLGLPIGRETRGHRFHAPEARVVAHPDVYLDTLRAARVEPDLDARRASIREQVEALAVGAGGRAAIDPALLEEVTALCEWPRALLGQFDPAFLEVPSEVLIETMQSNQKYFPVLNGDGGLMPCFIAVSNIESRRPDEVKAGNERVIRPRFADASFFWDQDRRTPLANRLEALGSIVFQHQLGSLRAKVERIVALSGWIAAETGESVTEAERAAELAKCDLVTAMVGEFGSLQGVMGRYYALASGESEAVAEAIEQHYWPKHAGDRLPAQAAGRAVAVADRVDTLLGIFAIGQRPSGVKDPYGLRRAAIGVLRILIETPLRLDLRALLERAARGYRGTVDADGCIDDVLQYCIERLKRYYADAEAERVASADVVAAVLALEKTEPLDIDRRIHAVQGFRARPEAASLAAANKRTRNILRKAPAQEIGGEIAAGLLTDAAERALVEQLVAKEAAVAPLLADRDYAAVLGELAGLRDPLDRFFDEVMVMSEDAATRVNRLALLARVEALFLNVADISLLQE